MGCAIALIAVLALSACGGSDERGPIEVPEVLIGFNERIEPDGIGNELLSDAGADFVRISLNWAAVESVPGTLDFTAPDAIVAELERLGLRPLWTVSSAPCWAATIECTMQEPSLAPALDHFDDYASFVAAVAERYPEALGIEIWNEPNIPSFWKPTPDAALYRRLLAASADAVHASGSSVPVVMAGPSPTTPERAAKAPEKIPFVPFIEEVMSGPDAPDVDALGIHPYSPATVDLDPVEGTLEVFEQSREVAAEVAPELPIWVTETGLTTAGQYAVTREAQAEGLSLITGAFAAEGIPVITIHRFFDQVDPPFPFDAGFGVVEADRVTPKPSFCAPAFGAGLECET